jgi:Mitochondrial ribosomal protein (VAR1)
MKDIKKKRTKKIEFETEIKDLNIKIKEQKLLQKSLKKIIIVYVKGLKIFNIINNKYYSKWNGNYKKLLNIILPLKKKIIKKEPKKLSILEKMQHRIQLNKIKNKNFKYNLIKKTNLFLDYLISEKNNQEIKISLNQKFLLQKLDELKNNDNYKNEKIFINNNNLNKDNLINNNKLNKDNLIENNKLNKDNLIEKKKLNILMDKKYFIINNLFQLTKSNNLKSIYSWYTNKNKINNLLNILNIFPNNLFSYKLLIKNFIEKEKEKKKLLNKIDKFVLLFRGQYPKNENKKENNVKLKRTRKYIKSLITFNSKNAYYFNNNYNYKFFENNNIIPKNIYTFLEYSFLSLSYLISKPIFEITPNKVIIHLFYYHIKPKKKIKIIRYRIKNKFKNKINKFNYKNRFNSLFKIKKKIIYFRDNISIFNKKINMIKLQIISIILRQFFKKAIEFEIVRLYYPFYNTNIFVNLLGKMINKIKLRRILRRFFKKAKFFNPNKLIKKKISKIPSFLSGVKIRIAGRLLNQRIIPRKTVKTISKGSVARGKVIYLEKGRFTNKNKRGAFSITVTTGHIT